MAGYGGAPRRGLAPHWCRLWAVVADGAASAGGWVVAAAATNVDHAQGRTIREALLVAAIAVLASGSVLARGGLYRRRRHLHRTAETSRITIAAFSAGGAVAVALAIFDIAVSVSELAIGTWLSFVLVLLVRGYQRTLDAMQGRAGTSLERVVVVGAGTEARELVELMEEHPDSGFHVLGIVGDESVAARTGLTDRWLGPTDAIVSILDALNVDSVLVTTTGFRGEQFRCVTTAVLEHGCDVRISPGISRWNAGRLDVDSLVHEPFVSIRARRSSGLQVRVKRAIDIVGALVLLLAASPVMAVAATAIKLEGGGPVLFRQRRVGVDGAPFVLFKFRSMVADAESKLDGLTVRNERSGPLFKVKRDPRVTRTGAFLRDGGQPLGVMVGPDAIRFPELAT